MDNGHRWFGSHETPAQQATPPVIGGPSLPAGDAPAVTGGNRPMEECSLQTKLAWLEQENARLRGQLELTRFALDNMAESSFTVDSDGHFIDVNDTACLRLGYSRDELLGMGVADIDVHFTEKGWRLHWRRLRQSRNILFESRHRTKEGKIFPVEISVSLIDSENREVAFSFVRDLSGRKMAEAALRDSQERFRQLADNIEDLFWLAEVSSSVPMQFLYVSPAFQTGWGREIPALYADGRTYIEAIDPRDRQSVEEFFEQARSGDQVSCEHRVLRPDGTTRWYHNRAFPIRDVTGRIYRIGGFASDVTIRHQHATEMDTIAAVSRVLLTEKGIEEICREVPVTIAGSLELPVVTIELIDASSETFCRAGSYGLASTKETSLRCALAGTLVGAVAEQKLPLVVTDLSLRADALAVTFLKRDCQRMLVVPITTGENVHGALVVGARSNLDFHSSLQETLEVIANHLAQAIQRDATQEALKRSEREKAMILDSVPAYIWYKDCFNRILRVNRLVAESMGIKPEEAIEVPTQQIYPETADRYYQDDLDVIVTGRPKLGIIEPMRLANGEQIWLRTDKIPEFDNEGHVCGILVFAIEITELKNAQDKLRESQHRYAVATAAGKVGVWDWNLDSDYFFLDTNVKQLLGFSDEELPNSRTAWTQLIPIEDFERIAKATYDHFSGRTDLCVVEHRIRHKDGSYRWFLAQGTAIRDRHGNPLRITGAVTDVTEQRLAEHSSRAADARYRTLFDTSHDGIAFLSSEGKFEDVNRAFLKMVGWPLQRLQQMTFLDLRARDRRATDPPRDLSISGVYEAELVRPDGSRLWVSVNTWRVQEESGATERTLAIVRDVTALKEAEQRLRLTQSAVNQIDEGVVITDAMIDLPGPHILYVNPGFSRITGYSAEDVIGKTPRILQGPKTDRATLERARRALRRGEPFEGEIINYRKDGTEFHMQWVLSPIFSDNDEITHWVAVQRDVTKLRRATENTMKNERLAAIGEMVAGLAHEGRNALQRSQSGLFLLRKRLVDDPEKQRYISEIERAQHALQTLFEEVRGYAVPIRLERKPTSLDGIWREVAQEVREQTNLAFKLVEQTGRLDLTCRVDRFRISQVFRNVFENACAAKPTDLSIHIVVSETKLDRNPALRVEIRDNGPGLSPEEKSRIFDPFFTTKTKGTGLGMAIVKRIVEAHGGDVAADTIPNRGAVIILRLPREPM